MRAGLCLALLIVSAGPLRAQAASGSTGALSKSRVEALRLALTGPDDGAAIEAAGVLGTAGAAAGREPLVETLAAGGTPERIEAVLDALGKLGEARALDANEATVEVLELYAGHRSPDIRRRAIRALGKLGGPGAAARVVPTLLERLGDAAPDVRAAAAETLGARREAKAAPRLFALLALGDPAAAAPLAAVATPELVPRIADLAGTIDDALVATALGEYVKRADVPDKLRIEVLRTLARLPGAAATTALVEYVASVPAKGDRPSKGEAQKLIDARGTGP